MAGVRKLSSSAPASARERPPLHRLALLPNRHQDILKPSEDIDWFCTHKRIEFLITPTVIYFFGESNGRLILSYNKIIAPPTQSGVANQSPGEEEFVPTYAYNDTCEMSNPYSYAMQSYPDDHEVDDYDLRSFFFCFLLIYKVGAAMSGSY